MSARRRAASAILATTALTLTLTACGPDGTTTAAPSTSPSPAAAAPTSSASPASPSPASPSSASAGAGHSSAPGKPTATPSGSKKSPGPQPSPASDCTARAKTPGHKVINGVGGWGNPNRINANETKFVCGPDVPNDGYYDVTSSSEAPYEFAPGATAVALTGTQPQNVTVERLLQLINTCTTHNTDPAPYNCYGNMYDVTLDASGKITQIRELFHP